MSTLRREREEELRAAIRHAEHCGQVMLDTERRSQLDRARRRLLAPERFLDELALPQFAVELQLPTIPRKPATSESAEAEVAA